MSERPPPDPRPPPSAPRPPPPVRNSGCATAALVVFGLILLLPGLCTIMITNGHVAEGGLITVITFAVGFVGLIVIVLGLRRI
jgi:hypothetical protein